MKDRQFINHAELWHKRDTACFVGIKGGFVDSFNEAWYYCRRYSNEKTTFYILIIT